MQRDLLDDLQLGFFSSPTDATPAATVAPVVSVVPASTAFAPLPPVEDHRPSRGRSATRARTAVLFSRLQDMGLRGVDTLVLMRTRTVMVSHIGRTLRVNEGYAEAPDRVLLAIVAFATARTKTERVAAREVILAHDVERGPSRRRTEPARPGDMALLAQLAEAHKQLNAQWFADTLAEIPVRLSGRMATRLGHFDPGSRHTPPEIVMSRQHLVRHGWREGMHTLLHEMVHQWQHETGRAVDHGTDFRAKCREVGITPSARRDVVPIAKKLRGVR